MPEIGTSGLLSGVGKRGGAGASVPAPNLDSTPSRGSASLARDSHGSRHGLFSCALTGLASLIGIVKKSHNEES
jgi:hypothetical protein